MEGNRTAYSEQAIVRYYEESKGLQKPEQTVLNLLKGDLAHMNMLDVGVGAGRTTVHFAPIVKEYCGMDYAEGMVKVCQMRFTGRLANASFIHGDVRNLQELPQHHYDFVLFSFNGIDYMSAGERGGALEEINRVITPGGYLCLSSHNIQLLEKRIKFHIKPNLVAAFRDWITWNRVWRTNRSQLEKARSSEYVYINDGAHNFRLQTCYVRPSFQQEVLATSGFENIRYFARDGREIQPGNIGDCADSWIYYLCQSRYAE